MTKAIVAIADFYAHAASPSIHEATNFDSDFVGQELMSRILLFDLHTCSRKSQVVQIFWKGMTFDF